MKRVAVFGAGVGGLTACHQLSKLENYQIDVYESKDVIGGLARSSRDIRDCPIEYCWRVFFSFYSNLLEILKEIPVEQEPGKMVSDYLVRYRHVNFQDSRPGLYTQLFAYKQILNGLTACTDRLNQADNKTWKDEISGTSASNVFREVAPWLGLDREKASYMSVIRVGIELNILAGSHRKDYILGGPTSEVWFDNWQKLLISKGVNFHLNCRLESFDGKSAAVSPDEKTVTADYYIFGLPIEELARIFTQPNLVQLRDIGRQYQVSLQVFFNVKINLNANAFLVVDSPWDLIVLLYDKAYLPPFSNKLCGSASAWSIAVCTVYKAGINGKTFTDCSYDEVIADIWLQLSSCKSLQDAIKRDNSGFSLPATIKEAKTIIDSWSPIWNYQNEPKFSNNAGTKQLRPSYQLSNTTFISTAYVSETIDIFSMEAAAIAGEYVANKISQGESLPAKFPDRPKIFSPFRAADQIAYQIGLPNLWLLYILLIISILIGFIFMIYYKY